MTERDAILGRVREALRLRAPMPGESHEGEAHGPASAPPLGLAGARARQWLPQVGDDPASQLALFRSHCDDLKTLLYVAESETDACQILHQLAQQSGWSKVASHSGVLTRAALQSLRLSSAPLMTDSPYDAAELEKADAGITECDALVAQTGSVLITARSAGGRALSVLPPHHVVLARRHQLVADLPAAFELLERQYGSNYPSFISFITGPSRTGDIERILVLGAHGPKELTILLW